MYLEDSEQRDRKGVEVGRRGAVLEVELSPKELHSKQREDENEQEEKEQQRDNGSHWVEEGYHQVPKWCPVFGDLESYNTFNKVCKRIFLNLICSSTIELFEYLSQY